MMFLVEIPDNVIEDFYDSEIDAAEDICDAIVENCAMETDRVQVKLWPDRY
jgi:hypothetical protein